MTACPHDEGVRPYQDGWMVSAHDVVTHVALDDATFSSATSRYMQIPNGLDGAEQDAFGALIDRYMTHERVDELRPMFTATATRVVSDAIDRGGVVDAVGLGARFAVKASAAWLGWPQQVEAELLDWVRANWEASRSGKFSETAAVAAWYNTIIDGLITSRQRHPTQDMTMELINDTFLGRKLTREEITSILRNWTGGDLGSMALCIGVCLAHMSDDERLQQQLRDNDLSPHLWHQIIDEMLRLDDPFVANRRVARADVEVGGVRIQAGQRVYLNWTQANQDSRVFQEFDPQQNAPNNLVYGVGRHVCPGRYLASEQPRIFLQAVLQRTTNIAPADKERTRSLPPAGGYAEVPLRFVTD